MEYSDPRKNIKEMLSSGRVKELLEKASEMHGHFCPGLAFGVVAGYAGLKRLGFDNTGMEELMAVVECNNCFVDGIQMTTGCTFGNNALIYKDLGKTAVTIISRKTNSAVRLVLKPRAWSSENATDRDKEAAELFRIVVKERQNDPVASKRMRELWRELSFETVEKKEDELFDIMDVPAILPEYAPIMESVICSKCGEQVMATRIITRQEQPDLCISCADEEYGQVEGRGISMRSSAKLAFI